MATVKKERVQKPEKDFIPAQYQHATALFVIFLSLIVFFHEIVFDGKVFVAADSIASKSFETLISDVTGHADYPLWNPYIFCGMPGVASLMLTGERPYDLSIYLLGKIEHVFGIILNSPSLGWELMFYLIFGVGVYFFVWYKVKSKIAALVSGLAVMHSTFIVLMIMIGHMTKIPVLAFFPWTFLILEKLREKFSLMLSLLLILLLHFLLMPGHIQMIFYVYFALGIYYLFFLIRAVVRKEEWFGIIRSGMILVAASGIAFLMSGDQYLSTLEYSQYSMRGAGPIAASQVAAGAHAEESGGLDYDYATKWSYSPGEVFTFFVPSLYGFGWTETEGMLKQYVPRINTYIRPDFADAPQYMGVVVVVLAMIGFWKNRRDPFVQYLGIVVFVSLLISFGKEMPLLFDPMFNYFPMFNKFRIPVMILVLVQIFIPVLAAYGVISLSKGVDEKEKKNWLYAIGIFGAFFILSVVAKDFFISIYESFFSIQDVGRSLSQSYGTNQAVISELYRTITELVATDIRVLFFLLTVLLGGVYLYWNKKLSLSTLSVGLVLLVLFDLWRINYKPMEVHPDTKSNEAFSTPAYVKYLQSDTTLFRTLQFDENGQPPYDNTLAYYRIQSAYGYSGTKMRQIQDVFDVVGFGNPLMWGLMNVKYILSARPDSNQILQPVFAGSGKNVLFNKASLPRAFFVNRYEVASGIDILRSIKGMQFNPYDVAYLMEDPHIKVDSVRTGSSVAYTHFGNQDIELKAHATGNNLLFISETWYPEGWKAFIDGKETPIYRVNYMFRGVVVPAGEHTVSMKFQPRGFYLGKQLSLWINILVLGGIGFFVAANTMKKRQN
ncbi:MAG: YfhO family protein [Bacteroidota bacterium]